MITKNHIEEIVANSRRVIDRRIRSVYASFARNLKLRCWDCAIFLNLIEIQEDWFPIIRIDRPRAVVSKHRDAQHEPCRPYLCRRRNGSSRGAHVLSRMSNGTTHRGSSPERRSDVAKSSATYPKKNFAEDQKLTSRELSKIENRATCRFAVQRFGVYSMPSRAFNSALTVCGFALPPVCFIT